MVSLQQQAILQTVSKYPGSPYDFIADKCEISPDACRSQLSRLRKMGMVICQDRMWSTFGNIPQEKVVSPFLEVVELFHGEDMAFGPMDERGVIELFFDFSKEPEIEQPFIDFPLDVFAVLQQIYREKHHVEVSPFFSIYGVAPSMIGSIKADDVGRLVCVEGDICGHEMPALIPVSARVVCKRCKNVFFAPVDEKYKPDVASCAKENAGCGKSANETDFEILDYIYKDEQEFWVEELGAYDQANKSRICVVLDKHLIEHGDAENRIVRDGNTVSVVGVLRTRIQRDRQNRSYVEKYIDASSLSLLESDIIHLDISEEDKKYFCELSQELGIFDLLLGCVAPSIDGMWLTKKALLLGSVYVPMDRNGYDKRRNINLLVVGHVGLAKTQLARWWVHHYPRSMFVCGSGASSVGLFGSAIRQAHGRGEGHFSIMAGAFPRSDGGMCFVDEISKQIAYARGEGQFLEALEDRRVSISRGDSSRVLWADCPVVMLDNWRGMMARDESSPRVKSLPKEIQSALVNRCLLVDADVDAMESVDFENVAWRMLERFGEIPETHQKRTLMSTDMFMRYLGYARTLRPIIPVSVALVIKEHLLEWQKRGRVKSSQNLGNADITARLLDDFCILCCASAMLHLRDEVTRQDVEIVWPLFDHFLRYWAMIDGKLDMSLISCGLSLDEVEDAKQVLGALGSVGVLDEDGLAGVVGRERLGVLGDLVERGEIVLDEDGFYSLGGRR